MEHEHEAKTIEAFVVPEQRARYHSLLSDPRRRQKILRRLAHAADLDPRFVHPLPAAEHNPGGIEQALARRGAPDRCYAISEDPRLDGRELPLREALRAVVGYGQGTILSCIPGRLAYHESEEPGRRCILQR